MTREKVYEITRWITWKREEYFLGYSIATTEKRALENYVRDNCPKRFQSRGLRVQKANFQLPVLITDYRGKLYEIGFRTD